VITKRIAGRKDGGTSAGAAFRYGEGLKRDRVTGKLLDKSHRTRFGNFGLIDDGVYVGRDFEEMAELIELAATEMQSNCELNTKVGEDKKIVHLIVSFNQTRPSDAAMRDTEDSMLSALKLDENHFGTFLHNDNGYWHLHIFASRIDKIKHLGNPLWQDKTIRDRVCREVEIRHNLERDHGLHEINNEGKIVEVPRDERRKRQDEKQLISDRARTAEKHCGEKSFQTWCSEIRIGDRLKHSKTWQDLHVAAAAYRCEVKQKGAGFVICPLGEKGGIQLSKVGLKNLPAKFGAFQPANLSHQINPEAAYTPSPTNAKAANHYQKWREAKDAFKPARVERVNEQREMHKQTRLDLRAHQKSELEQIRYWAKGAERYAAVSIVKMQHTVALAKLTEAFSRERQVLQQKIAFEGPGNTFREFLIREAEKGDEAALQLARKYGAEESTAVSRQREADELLIVVVVSGLDHRVAPRLIFPYRVERSGTVIFDLGFGRKITDNAISRQVQLNNVAANSPDAIETALRFATTKFGNSLTLTGTPKFQRLAVETAVRKGLNINFLDPVLQAYKQEFAASISHNYQEKNNVTRAQPYQTSRIPPANRRDRLHQLSEFTLATESRSIEVLLPKNVPDCLADGNKEGRHGAGLRRTGRRGNAATELTAFEWAAEWAKATHKEIVEPRSGDGEVIFNVIHVGQDGIVLNMGRSVAVYPKPKNLDLQVGSKISVGKNKEILLQQNFRKGRER